MATQQNGARPRVVLAYSGGIEASAAIPWLIEQRDAAVVTVTLDLGQGRELEELRGRALGLGATRAHVLDVRDEFARDCILPALQSGVLHDPAASIVRIAHPLIARKLVEIAAIEQATIVAHGASPADRAAIEAHVHALNPKLVVIAIASEWGMTTDELAAYARTHGVVASAPARRSLARTPDTPAHVEVEFEQGVPVSVNGVPMPLIELIESVATIAGNHGVGGDNLSGSNTMCEVPAAIVLSEAHEALTGGANGRASGVVRMKLFKGEHTIVGHSPVAVARA
jgi:argininosuccinate synthase